MSEYSYDEIPYPSFNFPQTSPDRLATMAALYGMDPTAPARCRMFELGCGDGTNLLSHAFLFPDSEFVGVDLSTVHIADAKKAIERLELTNIRFEQADIIELRGEELGTFDYVAAHGLFSWVSADIRSRVLEIYATTLGPQGVGYISYNTFPGCHIRRIAWDLLRFHTSDIPGHERKVEIGRSIFRLMTETLPAGSIYKKAIEHELDQLLERRSENILHDDLAETNQPFYIGEFAELIDEYGLKYLTDADPLRLSTKNLSAEASELLGKAKGDRARQETYRDFFELTRFRCSLICRSETDIHDDIDPAAIADLYIASAVRPRSLHPILTDETVEFFEGPKGGSFEINHPLTKASLSYLQSAYPRSSNFKELLVGAGKRLANANATNEPDILRLQKFLLELFRNGFIKLHSHRFEFATEAGEKPQANKIARWQAERGSDSVVTLAGINIGVESYAVRKMIQLLDGSRTASDVEDELVRALAVPFSERHAFNLGLPQMVKENIRKMAEWGLLVR